MLGVGISTFMDGAGTATYFLVGGVGVNTPAALAFGGGVIKQLGVGEPFGCGPPFTANGFSTYAGFAFFNCCSIGFSTFTGATGFPNVLAGLGMATTEGCVSVWDSSAGETDLRFGQIT
jgi:hypothetical protein